MSEEIISQLLTFVIPLILCLICMSFSRQPRQPPRSEYWYINCGIQDAYNAIVEEAEKWRERAEATKSKGRFSFSRKKLEPFVVNQDVPPKLYEVRGKEIGEVSFELAEAEKGGTSIKLTYNGKARSLIQDFKARKYQTYLIPVEVQESDSEVCPSCGKEMAPDSEICPFCGAKK